MHAEHARAQLYLKRLGDVLISGAAMMAGAPALVVIALAIRLDSTGPALFRTSRVGKNNQEFTMYKFRTMVDGAPGQLAALLHMNVAGNGMVKIPDDPRVTRVGRWLRRYSLDELPQLWNVFRGDMSLVGPRPHDSTEIVAHMDDHHVRLTMAPGLTGLWQVTARSDPSLVNRVKLDLEYVRNWSPGLDLEIIARTVPAVLRGEGGRVSVIRLAESPVSQSVPATNSSE